MDLFQYHQKASVLQSLDQHNMLHRCGQCVPKLGHTIYAAWPYLFTKQEILDSPKLKEFADDNYEVIENS